MDVVVGVDGGNTKTELVAATVEGTLLARVRGPGSNSHGVGADGVGEVIAALLAQASLDATPEHGVFFLCGADMPSDIEELAAVVRSRNFAREAIVDNDTFALLRAGTDRADAVAVVCGAGINCVGRSAAGRLARYPALVEIVKRHFGAPSVESVGVDVHYRRLPQQRLGELAPLVVAAAAGGDAVARELIVRLAGEIGLWVERALRDLAVDEADVVLGGGMLRHGEGLFHRLVLEQLPGGANPVVANVPPVLGAALAALDAAGAAWKAKDRLRSELDGS